MKAAFVAMCLTLAASNMYAQDQKSVEAAIRDWKRVVAQNPEDFETLAAIGSAYGKLGDNATAATYFRKAIKVNPGYAPAYAGLGTAYGFLGRPEDAIAALRKAASLEPTDPLTHIQLGTKLGKAGRYKEAIAELKEAIRLNPDLPDAHFAIGLAYLGQHNRAAAVNEVQALYHLDAQLAEQLQALLNGKR
jgi:tetratricopeptide (TPR) repeat protein